MEPSELLSRFSQVTVLVVGDVLLDEYLSGDCSRISPEAPVPIVRIGANSVRWTLGGAANTAANVASLGGRVALIGMIGRDSAGEKVEDLCRQAQVRFSPQFDGRPTIRKSRVVGQRQQLLRLDYEESSDVRPDTEALVLSEFRRLLADASIVVLSDYAKGLITRCVGQSIITEAHAAGKEVLVDPRPEHLLHYLQCDYITPNWKESRELLGQPPAESTPECIHATGTALRERLGCHVVLTLGPGGMMIFDRDSGSDFALPTVTREVFDVSGAGDTVVATLALARAAGADLRSSARLANQAAGIVVGKLGTATLTADELRDARPDGTRLVSRAELPALAARLKAQGRTLVTLNGSFDLLHAGHLHIIHEAKRQGDVLIVGLNSDASVRSYKGPSRPIVSELNRAALLLALSAVDYVHIFDEAVPMPFLEAVRPQVHVNGSEYGADCIEAPTVRAFGGRVHIVDKVAGLSTSEVLARIRAEA